MVIPNVNHVTVTREQRIEIFTADRAWCTDFFKFILLKAQKINDIKNDLGTNFYSNYNTLLKNALVLSFFGLSNTS